MHAHETAADTKWRMISQTAEYALRVVLHVAARRTQEPTSAAEAAATLGVPERYLARVLNTLSHEGVLTSTRGAQGGFRLAIDPGELTLAAVVGAFDAVGEPPQCLLRTQRCGAGEPCIAHQHWHDVAASVRQFFQETTIADLIGPAATTGAVGSLLGNIRSSDR